MEQQEKQNQDNIKLLQKQAESDQRMAVLNTKEEYNNIIEELKAKSNREYKELLEQLEELRKENHQLEKNLLQKPASTRTTKKKVDENKKELE